LTQAKSRNKQLQRYQGNWAALEILKTLIKNKRTYQKRIGPADQSDEDVVEELEGNDDELEKVNSGGEEENDDNMYGIGDECYEM
jgi:hypothetical protein